MFSKLNESGIPMCDRARRIHGERQSMESWNGGIPLFNTPGGQARTRYLSMEPG